VRDAVDLIRVMLLDEIVVILVDSVEADEVEVLHLTFNNELKIQSMR
jgi:hypothetical protein